MYSGLLCDPDYNVLKRTYVAACTEEVVYLVGATINGVARSRGPVAGAWRLPAETLEDHPQPEIVRHPLWDWKFRR